MCANCDKIFNAYIVRHNTVRIKLVHIASFPILLRSTNVCFVHRFTNAFIYRSYADDVRPFHQSSPTRCATDAPTRLIAECKHIISLFVCMRMYLNIFVGNTCIICVCIMHTTASAVYIATICTYIWFRGKYQYNIPSVGYIYDYAIY